MKVPLFDIDLGEEEEAAVLEVLRSKWLSTGPKTAAFEQAFAEALGVPHAVAVANGTAALHLATVAVGNIAPGDEIIVPSLTFVATANAARYVGAKPVFVDIGGGEDLNIDPDAVEAAVTRRTRAIIVMHYAGFPCDMERIMAIADRHGLKAHSRCTACHGFSALLNTLAASSGRSAMWAASAFFEQEHNHRRGRNGGRPVTHAIAAQ